jgi:PAS domain S-box-containing protein
VFVLDRAGRILHVNAAVRTTLGYGDTLIGRPVLDVHPPRERARAAAIFAAMLAGREASCSLPLLRADGTEISVDTRAVAGHWNGQPAVLGIARDLSEIQSLHDERVHRARYQQAVLDNFPFLVWLKDPQGRFLAVNSPFAFATGASDPDALAGKTDFDVWPADLAARYHADDLAVLASGKGQTVEEPSECDGVRGWIETYKSPVTLEGEIIGTVGFSRDITGRVLAREKLRESEALLRATLDATADGILVIGADGAVEVANRRFQELWRIPDALLATGDDVRLLEFVVDQLRDPDSFLREVRRLYASGEESWDVLTFRDGRVFERYSVPMPLHDPPSGAQRARVWSFRDVTDRNVAEAALRAERDVFVGGPVGVLIWQPDWTIDYASPNIAAILGRTVAELTQPGFRYGACLHPDDVAHVAAESAAYRADPGRANWEQRYRILRADGEVRSLYDFTVAERNAGALLRLRGYVMDETAARAATLELARTKEQLEFAIEGSGVGLWDWDLTNNRTSYNERWAAMLGYTRDALGPGGSEVYDNLCHPDDLAVSQRAFAAHVCGLAPRYIAEIRLRHRTGHWVWVLDQGKIVERASDGTPTRAAGTHLDITTRKAMEAALLHERSFLKTLIQTIPDLVWFKDPAGVYRVCNPRFEELYGAKEADIVGRRDADFVDAAIAASYRANDIAAIEANRPRTNVEWLSFADGRRGLFETTKTPMRSADGALVGVLGIAHDVTAARHADEALRASESMLRSILDNAADAVFIANAQGRYQYVNQQACRMLGYTQDELLARGAADVALPGDLPRFAVLADGGRLKLETQLLSKTGDRVPVEIHLVRLPDGTALGVCRDIAERKYVEAELARHRHHLEVLVRERTAELEAANRQLQVSDLRLKAMFEMSQRADQMAERELLQLGIAEAVRLTGRTIGTVHLVNEDQQPSPFDTGSAATLAHCTAGEESHHAVSMAGLWADTLRVRRPVVHNDAARLAERHGYPAGRAAVVRQLGVPVLEKGKVCMVLAVANKPTDYDDADVHELQLIGDDLWRIVMRRRAEAALEVARDAAEEASRAKSTFLASMSHEIRTPMNAIIGLAHLAGRDAREPAQRERLAKIGDAAAHLLGVINDILDLAKIEAGRLTLDSGDFQLDQVLATLHTLVGGSVAAKGLELVYDIDPALDGVLRGDALRLGQVLLNLVGNAVKFADRGAVVVRARVQRDEATGIMARFEIEDAGIGIARDVQSRLFTAFERADSTTTRRHGGTGLGLAISRHLLQLMGGEIGVDSEPGAGSVFWFTVGLARGATNPGDLRLGAAPARGSALVIDRLPQAAAALAGMMRTLGYATVTAAGLAEAAPLLLQPAPDAAYAVVLVEWPADAATRAKADTVLARSPSTRSARIIATVVSGDAVAPGPLPRGFAGVLCKPVTLTALRALLEAPRPSEPGSALSAAVAVPPLSADLARRRVLLVEDNPVNREVAVELLREARLGVDTAVDGAEALDLARRTVYDLVLMDVQMPVMDGLVATRALRRLPGWSQVPIVAMTANAFADDRLQCLAAGMSDYVSKPVEPARLYAVLQQWLPPPTVPGPHGTSAPSGGALAGIAGLDARAGLANVRDNLQNYHRLLRLFDTTHRGDMERWRALVGNGDVESARRLAHSLKGSAGILGIVDVAQRAATLETAMRERAAAGAVAALADAVGSELERVLDALKAALG